MLLSVSIGLWRSTTVKPFLSLNESAILQETISTLQKVAFFRISKSSRFFNKPIRVLNILVVSLLFLCQTDHVLTRFRSSTDLQLQETHLPLKELCSLTSLSARIMVSLRFYSRLQTDFVPHWRCHLILETSALLRLGGSFVPWKFSSAYSGSALSYAATLTSRACAVFVSASCTSDTTAHSLAVVACFFLRSLVEVLAAASNMSCSKTMSRSLHDLEPSPENTNLESTLHSRFWFHLAMKREPKTQS